MPDQVIQDTPLGVSYSVNDLKLAIADLYMRERALTAALARAQAPWPEPPSVAEQAESE